MVLYFQYIFSVSIDDSRFSPVEYPRVPVVIQVYMAMDKITRPVLINQPQQTLKAAVGRVITITVASGW